MENSYFLCRELVLFAHSLWYRDGQIRSSCTYLYLMHFVSPSCSGVARVTAFVKTCS